MSIEFFSIILLLFMFVAAAIKPINLGVMGIVAAFLLGTIGGGLTVDEIFGGYPGGPLHTAYRGHAALRHSAEQRDDGVCSSRAGCA